MARIVIGTRQTGELETLYLGESGVAAEEALESASAEEFVLVEYIPHPQAAKRRKFPRLAVPESGTAEKPAKKAKPAKPAKPPKK